MSTGNPLPGFYKKGDVMERWDGTRWTGETQPLTATSPDAPTTPSAGAGAIVPIGYVLGVLFPIVGVILGIIALNRANPATKKHGPWIIVVALVAAVIWVIIVTSAASSGGGSCFLQGTGVPGTLDAQGNCI